MQSLNKFFLYKVEPTFLKCHRIRWKTFHKCAWQGFIFGHMKTPVLLANSLLDRTRHWSLPGLYKCLFWAVRTPWGAALPSTAENRGWNEGPYKLVRAAPAPASLREYPRVLHTVFRLHLSPVLPFFLRQKWPKQDCAFISNGRVVFGFFPCNMVIRCHIRWDLLLLRAQNLVARSGFVVGMQSI